MLFVFRIRHTFIKVEKVYRVIKVNMAQTIKRHVEKNCSTTTEFFSSFFNLLSFTQESSSKGVIFNELRFCDSKRDCLGRQCWQSINDSKLPVHAGPQAVKPKESRFAKVIPL